jgi:hypothetical protein
MAPPWRRKKKRKKRPGSPRAPVLSVPQILAWAEEYYRLHNTWPKRTSGEILGSLGETWFKIDKALRNGTRGLPGGSSLARLLEEHFGVRNKAHLPRLSNRLILHWCDHHHEEKKEWPTKDSGPVPGQPGETWANVDAALRQGLRGLRGGSSLAQLLAKHRRVVNVADRPPLSEALLEAWARPFHRREKRWPTRTDGPIPESDGDTWASVDAALHRGTRGLPGGSSLARLLAQRCGVRNLGDLPPLTEDLIVEWMRDHRRQKDCWPRQTSGPVLAAPGETWGAINKALREGGRGVPGGSSLAELLARRLEVRNNWHLPPLSEAEITVWCEAHEARKGHWPTSGSGPIDEAPEETWEGIDAALRKGRRGLPGGSSLARLRLRRDAARRKAGEAP